MACTVITPYPLTSLGTHANSNSTSSPDHQPSAVFHHPPTFPFPILPQHQQYLIDGDNNKNNHIRSSIKSANTLSRASNRSLTTRELVHQLTPIRFDTGITHNPNTTNLDLHSIPQSINLHNHSNCFCKRRDSSNSTFSTIRCNSYLKRRGNHCLNTTANIATLRRSLTSPLSLYSKDAMTCDSQDATTPTPGSPPDLTGSKSSKNSSFHSSSSHSDGIESDLNHFETIGLDDDTRLESEDVIGESAFKTYTAPYIHELRNPVKRPSTRKKLSMQRELMGSANPAYPNFKGHTRQPTGDVHMGSLRPGGMRSYSTRGFTSPSTPQLGLPKRNRSVSPNSLPPNSAGLPGQRTRRGSWQANTQRKTQKELEKECEEDDGDELPDDILLENVPISPRPFEQRKSQPPSPNCVQKKEKEKAKPAGNGTPPIPVAQGSLRSPMSPKPPLGQRGISMGQFPISHDGFGRQPRAKSWTAALSELSEEAKALTEALEAHADELTTVPMARRSASSAPTEKRRVQSSIAALPPLRNTEDMMIDPLPISKEKEAVLSRTRPSWLPPKNPLEEKKHLREYQRMMALSLEAERKKEAEKRVRESSKDNMTSSLARIWEEHVLPNWDAVVSMKRTRELWWRGISPKSRGKVWQRAVGNELDLSEASFQAALKRANDLQAKLADGGGNEDEKRHGRWFASIKKDAALTFPELRIFQAEGPLYNDLIDVVNAYSVYRSDVGYLAGLNTIAALLLLNLPDPTSSFITLCNILNRALPNAFLTHDPMAVHKYMALTLSTLSTKLPTLFAHLDSPERPTISLTTQPDIYLVNFFTSLFTQNLDLESITRLWDVWVFEGDAVLIRAAVALFDCCESRLYACSTKNEVLAVLKQPEVRKEGSGSDDERWMCAVRDAGRGTSRRISSNSSSAANNGNRTPVVPPSPGLMSPGIRA